MNNNATTSTNFEYIFLQLNNKEEFIPYFKKLCNNQNVISCDATRGILDVILLYNYKSTDDIDAFLSEIRQIKSIKEVYNSKINKSFTFKNTQETNENQQTDNIEQRLFKSYVIIETQQEKFESVLKRLCSINNVISCNTLNDESFKIILQLQSQHLPEINDTVSKTISRLDGVTRTVQCDIISPF